MNSGRIAIGLVLIVMLAGMLVLKTVTMPSAFAAVNDNESTTASVTVNGIVSTTAFVGAGISFPNTDAGTSNVAASTQPILQIDGITNVDVMVYTNATNFTGGGYGFLVENMTINVTTTGTATDNSSCNTGWGCVYKQAPVWVLNETAPLGTAKNETLGHFISIPAGQYPTTYTSSVTWCTQQQSATIDCD